MALLRPGRCCSRPQGGCLQHRAEAQRRPKGQHAGGTPALPGDAVPAVRWGGVWRATSQKADLHPLGNSRLPASPAPAPHDGADHSRVKQVLFQASRAAALAGGSFEEETFSRVCQNRCKGVAPAVKPRSGIGAPCPKASLGPSRPSFISEASLEALLKVRIRTTTPTRAGAASSRHHLVTVPLPVG